MTDTGPRTAPDHPVGAGSVPGDEPDGDSAAGPVHDRDRDEHGRPENARPRDRTGRPLPRDTDVTALTEEVDPASVEDALARGVQRWRQRRFFEAHEFLEHVWHWSVGADQRFWQGVIQVAVAYVHHQRDNPYGVVATCGKALRRLEGQPDRHHGIDVAGLRRWCEVAMAEQAERPGASLDPPSLGLGPKGAWLEPGSLDTPLERRGDAHRGTADTGGGS